MNQQVKKRNVNIAKCNTCANRFLCIQECVTSNLQLVNLNGKEYPTFKERGYCINCGHCNAICPTGAIQLTEEQQFDNDFLKFLASKRTVRSYNREREISEDKLDLIIQAGQSAPTQKNRPTVKIVLVKEKLKSVFLESLEVLKTWIEQTGVMHPQYRYISDLYEKKSPIFWNAEYAVIITGRKQYTVDAALAAERMQLMASSLGISSGYNGNLTYAINQSQHLRKTLSIFGEDEALVGFALGYSNIEYQSPYICKNKKIVKM